MPTLAATLNELAYRAAELAASLDGLPLPPDTATATWLAVAELATTLDALERRIALAGPPDAIGSPLAAA